MALGTCGDLPGAVRILEPHRCWCPRPSQLWDMQGPAWGSPDTGATPALPPLLCPRHGWAEPSSFQVQHSRCHPARHLSARKGLQDQEQLSRPQEWGGQSCWEVLPAPQVFCICMAQGCPSPARVGVGSRCEPVGRRGQPCEAGKPLAASPQRGTEQLPRLSASSRTPRLPPQDPPSPRQRPPSPPSLSQFFPEAGAAPGPPARPHLLAPEPGAILILANTNSIAWADLSRTDITGWREPAPVETFPRAGQRAQSTAGTEKQE